MKETKKITLSSCCTLILNFCAFTLHRSVKVHKPHLKGTALDFSQGCEISELNSFKIIWRSEQHSTSEQGAGSGGTWIWGGDVTFLNDVSDSRTTASLSLVLL